MPPQSSTAPTPSSEKQVNDEESYIQHPSDFAMSSSVSDAREFIPTAIFIKNIPIWYEKTTPPEPNGRYGTTTAFSFQLPP